MTLSQRFRTYVLLTAMLSVGLSSQAQVIVLTDTLTTFSGTFSATGGTSPFKRPTTFAALPDGTGGLTAGRIQEEWVDENDGTVFLSVGTSLHLDTVGTPGNPNFSTQQSFSGFGPLSTSGTYNNGGASGDITVNWSFSNLVNTPGANGTFSGNFSFEVVPVAVPEPSGFAAIASASLVAFGLWRRKRK